MDVWLTATFTKDKFTATHDTICQALMSRCGAVVQPRLDGSVEYHLSKAGTKQLKQADILTLQQDADMDLSGKLFEEYYLILPVSTALDPVPEGFPDRTYLDDDEVEQVRTVIDYVAWYRVSTNGLAALVRCTHKVNNEDTSGISLDPDNFKLWHDVAMAQSVHTAVQPDGLIESVQAVELMTGNYTEEE